MANLSSGVADDEQVLMSSSTTTMGTVAYILVGTGCLSVFFITMPLIPVLWVKAVWERNKVRAILTDRAFHTAGGVIDLDQIVDIELSGPSLKVRGQGSVYRLTCLTEMDEMVRMLRERVRAARTG